MAQRLKIGLIFSYNENWIAGAYYIENLIHALNTLPDFQKPDIFILSYDEKDFDRILQQSNYPYLHKYIINIKYNILERIINKISRTITKRNFIEKFATISRKIDVLFPAVDREYFNLISYDKKIYWIPDFQEDYLPHFFSEQEIIYRKTYQKHLSQRKTHLVFSSQDALNDFKRLYPEHICKTYVLNFAVTHKQKYQNVDIQQLIKKYDLKEKYFFSPNQFWAHKNHITALKAVKLLKEQGQDIMVAFSGKQEDYRNPNYFQTLQNYVIENKLEQNIRFLGFIDRTEQLALMKHAVAIIQPSLFEGWSTVVEDAKAMGQRIILSNLNVHIEQTTDYDNKILFNPHKPEDLAEKIRFAMENPTTYKFDYKKNIEKFGKDFMHILMQVYKS
ncbi:MAG: glycosyltransferase family 1 protein [Raineya sp.]